ncbi:DUF998 domain-containing protein [uncultured Clostridium sp.]|uniref:DUF998 domain-containing protein n=1 Tax=uncultured Clostridium sp. TaxID=59620 RepID=UPI0028E3280A|nr:DUF998 domain-containing protein [uncultured Clostridium sp.]
MIDSIKGSFGWVLLLIAIVGDFIVPYILAIFYKGYSHKTMVMSSLGNPSSPVRGYYNIWLICLGALLSISTLTLYRSYSKTSKVLSASVVTLIIVFAIGAGILSGIFSVNESKDVQTVASQIHGFGAAIGFMALLFVPMLLGILSFKSKDNVTGVICLISFVFALIFFILFIMADKPEFNNTIIANEGLWQRLTLLFMYVPFGYIAIKNIIEITYN